MASTVQGRGAHYDVRPAGEHPGVGGLFGFCKDGVQGACAGLLGLLGATHMTGAPAGFAELHSNIPWLDTIWSSISAGGLAGPVELLGGVALFFAARRTIARLLGLLLFIAFITAYANGYSASDMLSFLANVLVQAAGALEPAGVGST